MITLLTDLIRSQSLQLLNAYACSNKSSLKTLKNAKEFLATAVSLAILFCLLAGILAGSAL